MNFVKSFLLTVYLIVSAVFIPYSAFAFNIDYLELHNIYQGNTSCFARYLLMLFETHVGILFRTNLKSAAKFIEDGHEAEAIAQFVNALRALNVNSNRWIHVTNPPIELVKASVAALCPKCESDSFYVRDVLTFSCLGQRLFTETQQLFDTSESYSAVKDAAGFGFFEGKDGYVTLFATKLADEAARWVKKSDLFAPYLALINAPMMGKSRLVLEMSSVANAFIFPMCFRVDENTYLFPQPSLLVIDWAALCGNSGRDPDLFVHSFCAILDSCLVCLLNWLLALKLQDNPKVWSIQELTKSWKSHVAENIESSESFWAEALSLAREKNITVKRGSSLALISEEWRPVLDCHRKEIRQAVVELARNDTKESFQLIFFIDEARQLNQEPKRSLRDDDVDRFDLVRVALRCLPFNDFSNKKSTVFCVVADTTSRMANLVPKEDRLKRWFPDLKKCTKLPSPFTQVMTLDIWWEVAEDTVVTLDTARNITRVLELIREKIHRRSINSPSPPTVDALRLRNFISLDLLDTLEVNASFGRPFLYGFVQAFLQSHPGEREAAKFQLLALLQKRLINSAPSLIEETVQSTDSLCTAVQAVSVLGTLVPVQVYASTPLAIELTASGLWPVGAISHDRESVFLYTPAEPLVALAAKRLVTTGIIRWETVLHRFAAELQSSTSAGFVGETAGQILTVMASHKASKALLGTPIKHLADAELRAIPAFEFLEAMFGFKIKSMQAHFASLLRDDLEDLHRDLCEVRHSLANKWLFAAMEPLINFLGRFPENWGLMCLISRLSQSELDILLRAVYGLDVNADINVVLDVWRSVPGDGSVSEVHASIKNAMEYDLMDFLIRLSRRGDLVELVPLFELMFLSRRRHPAMAFTPSVWRACHAVSYLSVDLLAIGRRFIVLSDEGFTFGQLLDAAEAHESLEAWSLLKTKLADSFVRLNQCVKTTAEICPGMLLEFFVKGAGIGCKEGQFAIDSAVPLFHVPSDVVDKRQFIVKEEAMSIIGYQFKLHQESISEKERLEWSRKFQKLGVVDGALKAGKTPVGIFFEFGPIDKYGFESAISLRTIDHPGGRKRERNGKLVAKTVDRVNGFIINCRGLLPSDIDRTFTQVDVAMKTLLQTALDPTKSLKIGDEDKTSLKQMFRRTTFYGTAPASKH